MSRQEDEEWKLQWRPAVEPEEQSQSAEKRMDGMGKKLRESREEGVTLPF